MSYKDDMTRCLGYMEAHLRENPTVDSIASEMGYSLYHFCRMFKSIQGISVGGWMRQRRLEYAAEALLAGQRVTDVAISWGFDTPSGFTKAFRRQFGVNPKIYVQKGGIINMTPEIKKTESFSAVGYRLAPPEGEFDVLEAGAYWLGKDFSAVSADDYAKLTYPGFAEIGAWMHADNTPEDMYYFFGPVVKDKSFIPEGMVSIDIPAAQYAVFTVPAADSVEALNENIRKTWCYIFGEWFDGSDYKYDESKVDFEYYCGEITCIYVPVVKK